MSSSTGNPMNYLGNEYFHFPSAYFPEEKKGNKNKGKELPSKHEKHEGFRRIKGRIYCRECDNRRNRQRRDYNRNYQRKLRREQGRPSATPVFDKFIDWSATASGRYTITELSAALGIPRDTVATWVKRGWVDSFLIRNRTKSGLWRQRIVIEV